jgi:23S rRNA U2552 (ribose-2'-O)-methylase RlmE/FtsJ
MISYEDDPTTSCLAALRPPQGLTEWRYPKSPEGIELCKYFMQDGKTCNAGDACVRSHQPRHLRYTCPSWKRYGVCDRGSTCWFPHLCLDPEPADVDLALHCYVGTAHRVVVRCRELFGADCVVGSSRADLTKNSVCVVFIRCGGAMRGLRMLAECDDAPHLVGNLRRLFVLTDDSKEGTGPDELASDTFATNALTGETHDELCDALRTIMRERLAVASRAHARKFTAVGDERNSPMKLRVRGFPKPAESAAVDAATEAVDACDAGALMLSPADATHCLDVVTSRGRVYVSLWSAADVAAEEIPIAGEPASTEAGGLVAYGIPLPKRGEATMRDLVYTCERVQEMRHASPPPCRAYYKIEEAFARSGVLVRKDWRCVDVGASPGGWTSYLSSRLGKGNGGGHVWAVDPAALSGLDPTPDNVTHLRLKAEECEGPLLDDAAARGLLRDAADEERKRVIDLVVCDANMAPLKVADMLASMRSLMREGGWLVTTFKNFCRGVAEWEREVVAAVDALAQVGFEQPRVYHLFSNCPYEKTLVARYVGAREE